MHFKKVQKTKENAERVMEWRNDPVTLSMSYHSEPKIMPSFYQEFIDTYFAESKCPPVFAIEDGERVAFLKFSRYGEISGLQGYIVDISINVKPSARCKGLGVKILQEVSLHLQQQGVDGVVAEIKKENIASQKAFARAGFTFVDEQSKYLADITSAIEIVRLFRCFSPQAHKGL